MVGSAASIDTTTTATDTNISQDLLFSMPISRTNAAVNILNNAPGITEDERQLVARWFKGGAAVE